VEQMRQAGKLHNDAVSLKAHLDTLTRDCRRQQLKGEQAAEELTSLDVELEELTTAEQALQARLASARDHQAGMRGERERLVGQRDQALQDASDLRAQRGELVGQIEVLEDLERSQEGLSTGTREVLAHLESADPGPWKTVGGIVAD